MRRRSRFPDAPMPATTASGQLVLSERLATFRRLYRWLNLTLIHQGIWPLLILVFDAPAWSVARTPFPWYLARLGAPLAAALLAWLYLRQRPLEQGDAASPAPPRSEATSRLAEQARLFLVGVPLMVAVARLAVGPQEPVAKLIVFGLADVAAYHLIHFGVVVRSYRDPAYGTAVATLLFAVSWGLRDMALAALGPDAASLPLAFAGGFVAGLGVALLARAIRRWPGGALPAAAAHWLIVYLIVGFAG